MKNQPVILLIRKEVLLEFRQKQTLFGMILYMVSTVFSLYMMTGQPDVEIWNALFWIAQLFITVNTVAKSFLQEKPERLRYYYTLVSPVQFVLSKLIYSFFLSLGMTLISFAFFLLLLGNPLRDWLLFMFVALLGSLSLGLLFTFLSAIAAQARQNAAMMAILGFPIAIPMLIILSKMSQASMLGAAEQQGLGSMFLIMGFLAILIFALASILFPFLWQE
ncbi:MAG TPA: heme exporter protein CcmB [Chitinophagaceae bacterium]|nr:heme exporter protein CcmB [Chitinophagaceae bacterium]